MNDQHWSVAAPQTLEVDGVLSLKLGAIGGRFDVVAHDEPVTRVTISELEGDSLEIHFSEGLLELRHGNHDVSRWLGSKNPVELPNRLVVTISAPATTAVDVGTISGDGLVSGIDSQIKVSSVSGSLMSDSTRGSLSVKTISGEAIVRSHSGELSLNSASGEATASGDLESIKANSATGDLSFDCWSAVKKISTNTVSGSILIRLPEELAVDLSASSVAGQIDVNDETVRVLGNTKRSFGNRDNGVVHVNCTSVSGSVTVVNRMIIEEKN
ncbi:hypothetical protein FHU41_001068 [Psychromicrobium silvestre]|uniref:DUF4097 domain-containing protein n=1 Tax=Psychromicrobium silvestre TaxID=1645614 RepID=A0A7Y9LSM0_9MICC|nr:DUF4097 family beta strand repeat-containing protein [Psychromicrobium silvestre]NYE94847.1 hypothetical protein [Psychromicrobium silvestre]